jgi:CO/xanthine dehydrogenase Mo-binding subunit
MANSTANNKREASVTSAHTQPATTVIGHSYGRPEAQAKVTGRAEYIHNLVLPRMLHTKVLRSTVAHARIVSIDTSAAKNLPGVHAVYTLDDIRQVIPDPYYGPAFHDQPILADGKVHYVGEPVAAVVAADPYVAQEALHLIDVVYDELPAVFDEVQAAESKVVVHDELRPAGTFPDLKHLAGRRGTNVALDFQLRKGDVEQAFAQAAHVFEHTFRTQQVMHTPLEPMISVAEPTDTGLTVHTASQSPSFVRLEIARLLNWPESKVRARTAFLGGGFGAKLYIKLEALAVALALLTRRPVRVAQTMEEQFYTITKHATTFRIKSAVDNQGRITGRQCTVWWNGGAYADIGPRVTQKSGFTSPGPYDIANAQVDSYQVYTNLPPAGAFRGFGITQLVWAYESQADIIARALGMDPVEFRRLNMLREGQPHATGTIVRDAALIEVLDCVAKRMKWNEPFDRGAGVYKRGRGVGVGFKALVAPTTSVAFVTLSADGSCFLHTSTVDMGQASNITMAMVAAEVLGLDPSAIKVIRPDTDVTPYDMATLGSRSTFHMGHAVRLAAEDAVAQMRKLADELGLPADAKLDAAALLKARYGMQAGTIVGSGSYIPTYISPDKTTGQSENITPNWMIGGCGIEVEVDTETGQFRILRMENVVDCGTPLNPKIVETQVSGAAIMQLGAALYENMEFDADGQLRNASFSEYKIPGIGDLPRHIGNEALAAYQHNGPYGAKGVGESGAFGVASAIAAAIEDAVGVRLTAMPMRAEDVYRGLQALATQP